ncbi:hypothetical protein CCUS01_14042 [Colletotrichum cuscutae]|uniref:Uncharacterized protein n=1 Tax=Colletotrichum cuscutae TaxID=1209917 RepID=A0AAI9YA82_9PEZI|nr:hypothetical protein CCUS01_14042 [Colletotrichum cuscutae]
MSILLESVIRLRVFRTQKSYNLTASFRSVSVARSSEVTDKDRQLATGRALTNDANLLAPVCEYRILRPPGLGVVLRLVYLGVKNGIPTQTQRYIDIAKVPTDFLATRKPLIGGRVGINPGTGIPIKMPDAAKVVSAITTTKTCANDNNVCFELVYLLSFYCNKRECYIVERPTRLLYATAKSRFGFSVLSIHDDTITGAILYAAEGLCHFLSCLAHDGVYGRKGLKHATFNTCSQAILIGSVSSGIWSQFRLGSANRYRWERLCNVLELDILSRRSTGSLHYPDCSPIITTIELDFWPVFTMHLFQKNSCSLHSTVHIHNFEPITRGSKLKVLSWYLNAVLAKESETSCFRPKREEKSVSSFHIPEKGNSGVSVQHEPITPGATFSWLVNGRMVCYFAAEDGLAAKLKVCISSLCIKRPGAALQHPRMAVNMLKNVQKRTFLNCMSPDLSPQRLMMIAELLCDDLFASPARTWVKHALWAKRSFASSSLNFENTLAGESKTACSSCTRRGSGGDGVVIFRSCEMEKPKILSASRNRNYLSLTIEPVLASVPLQPCVYVAPNLGVCQSVHYSPYSRYRSVALKHGDVSTSTTTHTTAPHTTGTHTTALPNRLESSHRFWNTTIDHNTSSISTAISLVTATPTIDRRSHGAGYDHLAAFFVFFLGVYQPRLPETHAGGGSDGWYVGKRCEVSSLGGVKVVHRLIYCSVGLTSFPFSRPCKRCSILLLKGKPEGNTSFLNAPNTKD